MGNTTTVSNRKDLLVTLKREHSLLSHGKIEGTVDSPENNIKKQKAQRAFEDTVTHLVLYGSTMTIPEGEPGFYETYYLKPMLSVNTLCMLNRYKRIIRRRNFFEK